MFSAPYIDDSAGPVAIYEFITRILAAFLNPRFRFTLHSMIRYVDESSEGFCFRSYSFDAEAAPAVLFTDNCCLGRSH